jgi:hypothetical protein
MRMKTMNMQDEQVEHQFIEALVATGVPISMKTRLINVPIDFEDEIEQTKDEAVKRAVAEQEVRKETFKALRAAGLPIPQDLQDDFQAKAAQAQDAAAQEDVRVPMLGLDPTVQTPNLAPTQENIEGDPTSGGVAMPGAPTAAVDPMGQLIQMPMQAQVPPESNEMRAGMPKPAALYRQASRMREITAEHFVDVGRVQDEAEKPEDRRPTGKFGDPKHLGMRRHAAVDKDVPMEHWGKSEEEIAALEAG